MRHLLIVATCSMGLLLSSVAVAQPTPVGPMPRPPADPADPKDPDARRPTPPPREAERPARIRTTTEARKPPPPPPRYAEPADRDEEPPPVRRPRRRRRLHKGSWRDTPTPVGGFPLQRRRFGMLLELGYPFLDIRFAYGAASALTLFIGYRGLYSRTNAGYGGLKVLLLQNQDRTVGLSLMGLAGYHQVRTDSDEFSDDEGDAPLIGGHGGFGELWLNASVRAGRHGMFLTGGVRVSDYRKCNIYDFEDEKCPVVLVTAFAEIGWEMRVMRYASYYIALGVDMFTNNDDDWLPAMIRFRTGLLLDF